MDNMELMNNQYSLAYTAYTWNLFVNGYGFGIIAGIGIIDRTNEVTMGREHIGGVGTWTLRAHMDTIHIVSRQWTNLQICRESFQVSAATFSS